MLSKADDEADNTLMNMVCNQRVTTCINDVRQFCEQNTGGSQFFNFLDKLEKYVTRGQFSAAYAALPELSSNWFTSPPEVTGHQKLYSMTDSETALNTCPVVSRGSVSLQITRN
ncbi:hypothetical protein DPMN_186149 [Dreissena polymorpha]|uniref:Uncharacterized protein n=1 Tax=Dreissena polymorpha TaxID=45954 RepID=A0A9D4DP60_DREPO|nr:hypothetical protein DPMN_186149 [Dreissena polymorpha]